MLLSLSFARIHIVAAALLCALVSACGQTGIRRAALVPETNLARPKRILLYDFAVSEQEVKEYQGIMRQQPNIKDAGTRERLLATEVKDALVVSSAGAMTLESYRHGRVLFAGDIVFRGRIPFVA